MPKENEHMQWMAQGHAPGTNERVTVFGSSREDVKIKITGRPYPVENIRYYGPIDASQ